MATIDNYKAAYDAAKAKGDTAGMNAAHASAEAIRAQQGYSGGVDGDAYVPLSGNAGNSTSGTASTTGSGGYVPLGNYNDQGASSQSQALINSIKQQYEAAKSQGAPQSHLDSLHQQAESIRSQYGYSGGVDGTQGIFLDDPNKYNKQPIAAPTSQSTYVDSLYEAQRRAALAALKSAYNQNVIDLDAQAAKIPQTYQAARNQTAAAAQQGQAAFDERAVAMGLNSGAGGQAALAMTNQNTANQNTINTQQANAVNDLDTTRLKISTAYQNDIAQAIAQGDTARAQALYQEAVRVDNGLVQQSMSQADENYRYWATNSNQQSQMAETLAKFGDFSGYLAAGYTPQQVEYMKQAWSAANTKLSGGGSYSGSGTGGGGTKEAATGDVDFGSGAGTPATSDSGGEKQVDATSPYGIATDIDNLRKQGLSSAQIKTSAKAAYENKQITAAQYQMYVQYSGRD